MMIESAHYAEMLRKKYDGMQTGPLFCWDVFLMETEQCLQEEVSFLNALRARLGWKLDLDFESLLRNKWTVVITDLDQHIIWTSTGFYLMTGYTPAEAIGKRPSFLQGKDTSARTKQTIAGKIRNFEPAEARLVNYRKDGEPYLCHVKIQAVPDQAGHYVHFLALEKKVR